MTIDRRNIFLWDTLNAGKYSPLFNPKQCDYSEEEEVYIIQNCDKPDFPWKNYTFKFYWRLKNELEEKKLRTYDCFKEGEGMFGGKGFFVHNWLLECWSDLIDKDIKVIPSTCSTLNGIVKEFHLIYIMNRVEGLDMNLSKMGSSESFRLVPKAENSFMKDHHLAIESEMTSYIHHSGTKGKKL